MKEDTVRTIPGLTFTAKEHANYKLPGGKTLSEVTFEDIRWQYGVFRCNRIGVGRDKKYFPWRAAKTKLGEIEERDWCKLVEAVIKRENETPLLRALIQWCNERTYISTSPDEVRMNALQLHADRVFDNPQWVGFISFNAEYRPEVLNAADIVFVRMACCPEIGAVTREQIDHAYNGQVACPHCGRWNSFAILEGKSLPNTFSFCPERSSADYIEKKEDDTIDADSPWEEDNEF